MNNKRHIRGLRQRALVVAGKADQINLLPLHVALTQLSAELLRPDLEIDPDGVEAGGVFLFEDFVIGPQRQAGIHAGDEKLVVNILGDQL